MKASKFNIITSTKEGDILIYNTLKNTFIKLNGDLFNTIQEHFNNNTGKGDRDTSPYVATTLTNLKKGGFIISKNLNENDLLKVNNRIGRFSDFKNMGLTIAPTMDCNFSCIYCYENDKKRYEYMSRDTEDKLLEYIDRNLKPYGTLKITWFGGEPLLALDTIYRLSENMMKIAKTKNSRYYAVILTNGYLLTPEVVDNLKKCNVDGAQITLDGPPEYHDYVRCLKGGGPTFYKIVDNIKKMDPNFMISISTNIGKNNVDLFPKFLDILTEYSIKNRIIVSIAQLQPREYLCNEVNDSVLSSKEFSNIYTKLVKMLVDRRIGTNVIPKNYEAQCASISEMGMSVGPDGCLYKCWDVIGNYSECVGKLDRQVKILEGSYKWLAWDVFDNEKCCSCEILPLCMGGCPRKVLVKDNILNRQDHCSYLKYNMPELLRILHTQYNNAK